MDNQVPATIQATLRAAIGLDFHSIGTSAVARAIRDRMRSLHMEDQATYEHLLVSSSHELQKLIEGLVVPETWFMRHPESFELLISKIKNIWPPNPPGTKIRILSIPCSTGEEPYSIAMRLLMEGFDPAAFEITALEISSVSLEACQKAVYGKNSFRDQYFARIEPFFEQKGGRFHLKESVKKMVTFRQANLVAPDFILPTGSIDFIFCRNLLIYLTSEAQTEAVQSLRSALRENGCFFCGPAEAAILSQNGFVSLKAPQAFGYERARGKPISFPTFQNQPVWQTGQQAAIVPKPGLFPTPLKTLAAPVMPPARIEVNPTQNWLAKAREYADRGKFPEAAEACHRLLGNKQSEVEAYHILGLVHDAQGQSQEAVECYKKVLYLNPNHQEALLHLALLKHKLGDVRGSRILQDRASRSSRSNPTAYSSPKGN